jgi:hypothetical protein
MLSSDFYCLLVVVTAYALEDKHRLGGRVIRLVKLRPGLVAVSHLATAGWFRLSLSRNDVSVGSAH